MNNDQLLMQKSIRNTAMLYAAYAVVDLRLRGKPINENLWDKSMRYLRGNYERRK